MTHTITGIVESVRCEVYKGEEKKIIAVVPAVGQRLFVEFRDVEKAGAQYIKAQDVVVVDFVYEGRTNKSTGKEFNNIVGRNIIKK